MYDGADLLREISNKLGHVLCVWINRRYGKINYAVFNLSNFHTTPSEIEHVCRNNQQQRECKCTQLRIGKCLVSICINFLWSVFVIRFIRLNLSSTDHEAARAIKVCFRSHVIYTVAVHTDIWKVWSTHDVIETTSVSAVTCIGTFLTG